MTKKTDAATNQEETKSRQLRVRNVEWKILDQHWNFDALVTCLDKGAVGTFSSIN